jgi:hypothetical protein
MLAGSFRFIIYPYMFMIGLLLFSGISKKIKVNKSLLWIPVVVTILLLVFQIWLDQATLQSPAGGERLLFGFSISNAIYYLGIWVLCALFSLIFAWTFDKPEEKHSVSDTNTLDM